MLARMKSALWAVAIVGFYVAGPAMLAVFAAAPALAGVGPPPTVDVSRVDQFVVLRNGIVFLNDPFDNGDPPPI